MLALPQVTVPTLIYAETPWASTIVFQPSCSGRSDGGADNWGAGAQGQPVRQNIYGGVQTTIFRGLPHQRQPREDGNEDKKNQDETQGQQQPQLGTAATSVTHADAQKTLNHKMAKRQSSQSIR